MKTKKTGTMKAWVCRDYLGGRNYCIYAYAKPKKHWQSGSGYWQFEEMCIVPQKFERHFFKLKPGAGPVPVEITIKRRGK